jgi:hypothetical protein
MPQNSQVEKSKVSTHACELKIVVLMLVFAALLSFESGRAKMSQKRKPVLLTSALLFAAVLLGLRNNPAGWWITMAALSAGAAFAIYEARQSWVARKSERWSVPPALHT